MLILRPLLIAALAATSVSAQSQSQSQSQSRIEKRYTEDYSACMDGTGGVTSEMMDCIGIEIDIQDARLNQAYAMVMRPLSKPKKDTLRGLQRAWIKQRDTRCQNAISGNNGTEASLIYAGCILEETVRRTILLENYKS